MTERISKQVGNGSIDLVIADITTLQVDAVVNAANSRLRGGGGVDGAIHAAAGPALMKELTQKYQRCPTGSAVMTGGGNLPAEHVIHAVGPIWSGGNSGEPRLLESAYATAFRLAAESRLRTVALAAISTGIYGYPLDLAAPVALSAAQRALQQTGTSLAEVTWALFSQPAFDAFAEALGDL